MLRNNRLGRVMLAGLLSAVAALDLGACGDDGEDDGDSSSGGENGGNGGGEGGGDSDGSSSSSTFGCCVNGSGYSCPSLEAANACDSSVCTPDESQCSSSGGGGGDGNGGDSGDSSGSGGGSGPCAGKSENDSCTTDWDEQGYCCESFDSNNQSVGLSCWEDPC